MRLLCQNKNVHIHIHKAYTDTVFHWAISSLLGSGGGSAGMPSPLSLPIISVFLYRELSDKGKTTNSQISRTHQTMMSVIVFVSNMSMPLCLHVLSNLKGLSLLVAETLRISAPAMMDTHDTASDSNIHHLVHWLLILTIHKYCVSKCTHYMSFFFDGGKNTTTSVDSRASDIRYWIKTRQLFLFFCQGCHRVRCSVSWRNWLFLTLTEHGKQGIQFRVRHFFQPLCVCVCVWCHLVMPSVFKQNYKKGEYSVDMIPICTRVLANCKQSRVLKISKHSFESWK